MSSLSTGNNKNDPVYLSMYQHALEQQINQIKQHKAQQFEADHFSCSVFSPSNIQKYTARSYDSKNSNDALIASEMNQIDDSSSENVFIPELPTCISEVDNSSNTNIISTVDDILLSMNKRHQELKPRQQEYSWNEMLESLKKFHRMNGHCNIPKGYKNKKLARWVKLQRREYKLFFDGKISEMSVERIFHLENLDFVWRPKKKSILRLHNGIPVSSE